MGSKMPGEHVSASPEDGDRPSRKHSRPCGVCGDRAKSFHFGGLSCDSCKAFFRRAVQNDAYKAYKCGYGGTCEITLSKRKSCQSCRYVKCLSIGMEPGWVMTDEERKSMQKLRQEKQKREREGLQKLLLQKKCLQPYTPDMHSISEFLNEDEREVVQNLHIKVNECVRLYPFTEETRKGQKAVHMFATTVLRGAHLSQMMPGFSSLPCVDQGILLRAGILEMCLLRGALIYDKHHNYYVMVQYLKTATEEGYVPVQLEKEHLEQLMTSELLDLNLRFIRGVQELQPDDITVILLSLIVLFCPDRPNLLESDRIAAIQEKYTIILRKYMEWRYGRQNAALLYPKLLTKLSDLQELGDLHTEATIRLSPGDVEEIQERLGSLNLNPYPQIDVSSYSRRTPENSAQEKENDSVKNDAIGISGCEQYLAGHQMDKMLFSSFVNTMHHSIDTILSRSYLFHTSETECPSIHQESSSNSTSPASFVYHAAYQAPSSEIRNELVCDHQVPEAYQNDNSAASNCYFPSKDCSSQLSYSAFQEYPVLFNTCASDSVMKPAPIQDYYCGSWEEYAISMPQKPLDIPDKSIFQFPLQNHCYPPESFSTFESDLLLSSASVEPLVSLLQGDSNDALSLIPAQSDKTAEIVGSMSGEANVSPYTTSPVTENHLAKSSCEKFIQSREDQLFDQGLQEDYGDNDGNIELMSTPYHEVQDMFPFISNPRNTEQFIDNDSFAHFF